MDLRVKLGKVSYRGWPPGLGVPGKTVSYSWRQGPGKNRWSFVPPAEVGGGTLAWGQSERGACLVVEAVRGVRSVRRRFGKPGKRVERGLIRGGGKCESLGPLPPLQY